MKSLCGWLLNKIIYRKNNYLDLRDFGPKIDRLVLDVWDRHNSELLKLSIYQLTAVVWGYSCKGSLSNEQMLIHYQLKAVVDQVLESLKADSVGNDKIIFVDYLVKNLISSKFVYLRDLTLLRKKEIYANRERKYKSVKMTLN
jgi:hypothetical protein